MELSSLSDWGLLKSSTPNISNTARNQGYCQDNLASAHNFSHNPVFVIMVVTVCYQNSQNPTTSKKFCSNGSELQENYYADQSDVDLNAAILLLFLPIKINYLDGYSHTTSNMIWRYALTRNDSNH